MAQQPTGNSNSIPNGYPNGFNGQYQMPSPRMVYNPYNPQMMPPYPGMYYSPMGPMPPMPPPGYPPGYPPYMNMNMDAQNYWHGNMYANQFIPLPHMQYPPLPIPIKNTDNKDRLDNKYIPEIPKIEELVEEPVQINNEPIIKKDKKLGKPMDIIIDENQIEPIELEKLGNPMNLDNPIHVEVLSEGYNVEDSTLLQLSQPIIPTEHEQFELILKKDRENQMTYGEDKQSRKHKKSKSDNKEPIDKFIDKFDNVLDGNIQEPEIIKKSQSNKPIYANSGHKSNIISKLTPVDPSKAHWNNTTHPKEQYNAVMMNGKETIYTAAELSDYTLETHQYINKHNSSMNKHKQGSKRKITSIIGFIYARCSTENDTSIETQITACLEYARNKGIKLLPFGCQYDNGISARNMNNLDFELGAWSDYLEDGAQLIIYSVDRLSRHLLKGLQYLDKMVARGVSVHFVMSEIIYDANISAAAKSMVQMELQAAEKVSNQTSEKVRATIKRKRAEGHVFGKAPFGYKHIKIAGVMKRIADEKEMTVIEHVNSLFSKMATNPRKYSELNSIYRNITEIDIIKAVIRDCNRKGYRYRTGKPLTPAQVRRILDTNYSRSDDEADEDNEADQVDNQEDEDDNQEDSEDEDDNLEDDLEDDADE